MIDLRSVDFSKVYVTLASMNQLMFKIRHTGKESLHSPVQRRRKGIPGIESNLLKDSHNNFWNKTRTQEKHRKKQEKLEINICEWS